MTKIFWAQHGRLFHAVRGEEREQIETALCGRRIPLPRMAVRDCPFDDDRCAKCDRLLKKAGDGEE